MTDPELSSDSKLRPGDVLTLDVTALAFGGDGVARRDGLVVFVYDAVPGDRVEAVVVKAKKKFVSARIQRILEPSPDRVEPRCPHFGACGGCRLQHIRYEKQLEFKESQVRETLQHIGGIPDPPVAPILGAHAWNYRNKMEFTFGATPDGVPVLGLHRPGAFDRVVDVRECHIQSPVGNRILGAAREFFQQYPQPPYLPRFHTGVLRNLVIRTARDGRDAMVCLVTTPVDIPGIDRFAEFLTARVPEVRSVSWFRNGGVATVALAGDEVLLHGPGHITEEISGLRLKVSPASFLQTNSSQAETLYRALLESAAPDGNDTAFDLYSGTGPIGLLLARAVRRVFALESNASAVADARGNASANGIDNIEFIEGEVERKLDELCRAEPPGLVAVDPPRPGLHKKALAALIAAAPVRIAYVSCNPATLARDAALLIAAGYALRRVRPVDMFPHTWHIECVADFVKS